MSLPFTNIEFERVCICQAMRRTARMVTRRYENALRPVGLKAGQFTILTALLRTDPVSISALASQLGMDRTTLTRDLAPLERRQLVKIVPVEGDGRVRGVLLSEDGRAILGEAIPLWRTAQVETERRLGDAEWPDIRNELDRLAT